MIWSASSLRVTRRIIAVFDSFDIFVILTWKLRYHLKKWGSTILQDHVTNWKHYIPTTTMLMATKAWRMVTNFKWLLSIKPHDHALTWFCEITWKTKIIIYPNKLGKVETYNGELPSMKSPFKVTWNIKSVVFLLPFVVYIPLTSLYPWSHTTLWILGHVRSHNKLKTYLNYYPTWTGCYMQ